MMVFCVDNIRIKMRLNMLCDTHHTFNMGLASKLKKRVADTASTIQGAKSSITDGGYNTSNLPHLEHAEPPPYREIEEVSNDAKKGVPNTKGQLTKPHAPPGNAINNLVRDKMWRIVCMNGYENIFTQQSLQDAVDRACRHDYAALMRDWNIATIDMTTDLAVLGLFDFILVGDDSGSMVETDEDGGSRWNALKLVAKTLGFWSTLMDPDGIVVRMFNNNLEGKGDGVKTLNDFDALFNTISDPGRTRYTTPMGECLSSILEKDIFPLVDRGDLARPVIIVTITDGCPNNKSRVYDAIKGAKLKVGGTKYGEKAICFSFAQVGCDTSAQKWLGKLDTHPTVGKMVDAVSNYDMESAEVKLKYGLDDFSPSSYLIKTAIGAIDPEYDQMDE